MTHATIDGNFKTAEQAIENVLTNQVAKIELAKKKYKKGFQKAQPVA